MELVVTKWIALRGTARLASDKERELCRRFPASMIRTAQAFNQYISTDRECRIASRRGAAAIYPLGDGGILNGLWYLAEQKRAGLEVDLRKIPIRQETVEICEFFGLNPYYMDSTGALLILAENGAEILNDLRREEICGAVIGNIAKGNDRILYNQGNIRYLDRPRQDELEKVRV